MEMIKTGGWTYKKYLNLSGDQRYEIHNGELLEMAPAPNFKHQKILYRLYTLLEEYIFEKDLGEIFGAPCDLVLSDKYIYQSDIVFISKEKKSILQSGQSIQGIPDLVIEILSPHNQAYDRTVKFKSYEKFKIKEYWIVDPEKSIIEVNLLKNNNYHCLGQYKKEDGIDSILFLDLHLSYQMLIERIRFNR